MRGRRLKNSGRVGCSYVVGYHVAISYPPRFPGNTRGDDSDDNTPPAEALLPRAGIGLICVLYVHSTNICRSVITAISNSPARRARACNATIVRRRRFPDSGRPMR